MNELPGDPTLPPGVSLRDIDPIGYCVKCGRKTVKLDSDDLCVKCAKEYNEDEE